MFWQCPKCHNIFCDMHAVLHHCNDKLSRIPKEIEIQNSCLVCKMMVKYQ